MADDCPELGEGNAHRLLFGKLLRQVGEFVRLRLDVGKEGARCALLRCRDLVALLRGFLLRENSLSGIGARSWANPYGPSIGGFTPWMGPHATSPSLLFMFGGTETERLPVYDCAKEQLADE
jgi:hypothetical protein